MTMHGQTQRLEEGVPLFINREKVLRESYETLKKRNRLFGCIHTKGSTKERSIGSLLRCCRIFPFHNNSQLWSQTKCVLEISLIS